MPSGSGLAPTNKLLGGLLVGVVGFGFLLWLAFAGPQAGEMVRLETLERSVRLEPLWSTAAAAPTAPQGTTSGDVLLFLDTSLSMAGFLPPAGSAAAPGFRSVVNLVPGHLVSTYGGTTRWRWEERRAPAAGRQAPRLERSLFTGGSSELDQMIRQMSEEIESGQVDAAVLITDLIANSGPRGSMGLAGPLLGWLRKAASGSPRIDFGLLGVRAPYWGFVSRSCPPEGELGCWYSEHARTYERLDEVIQRPFYILVIGHSGDEGSGRNLVEAVGEGLRRELEGLDLESRWELLSRGSRTLPATLRCEAGWRRDGIDREPQYSLYVDGQGSFRCMRDEPVELSCQLSAAGGAADGGAQALRLVSAEPSWAGTPVSFTADRLTLGLDCGALQASPPEEDLVLRQAVAAIPAGSRGGGWDGWSADTDETADGAERTLQLDLFLDTLRLRPERYRLVIDEPLLRVGHGG